MNILISHLTLLIFNVITVSGAGKLTPAENAKRLEMCGKVEEPKVFRGRPASALEAPWAVYLHVAGPRGTGACTATLISPRHLSCSTHCVYAFELLEEFWTETNSLGHKFDKSQCDKHGSIVIPERFTQNLSLIDGSIMEKWRIETEMEKFAHGIKTDSLVAPFSKSRTRRTEVLIGKVKSLTLFGFCRKATENYIEQYPDDFMIIELAKDVVITPRLYPACVARDTLESAPGTVLEYYGYGMNPAEPNQNTSFPRLRHESVTILDANEGGTIRGIDPRFFKARSVSEKTVACPGDSGGGALRKIDGRYTVVGVISRTTCAFGLREETASEWYATIGFYDSLICEYTGICNPPRRSSRTNFDSIAFAMLFLFLFLLLVQ